MSLTTRYPRNAIRIVRLATSLSVHATYAEEGPDVMVSRLRNEDELRLELLVVIQVMYAGDVLEDFRQSTQG
jgi:hypothetical protein